MKVQSVTKFENQVDGLCDCFVDPALRIDCGGVIMRPPQTQRVVMDCVWLQGAWPGPSSPSDQLQEEGQRPRGLVRSPALFRSHEKRGSGAGIHHHPLGQTGR